MSLSKDNRGSSRKNNQKAVTKQQVQSMIRSNIKNIQEDKFNTLSMANSTDYGGSMYGLTDIPQGDTDLTRDGDECRLTKINLHYSIVAGDATNTYRVICFRWKQFTTPTMSDMWFPLGATNSPMGHMLHDTSEVYDVLYDSFHTVDTYNPISKGQFVANLKGPKVQFTAGTTAGCNKLFLFLVSDSAAATHPAFLGFSAVNFTDS